MGCKDCKYYQRRIDTHFCKKMEDVLKKFPSDLLYRFYGTMQLRDLMVLETDGLTCGHNLPTKNAS